MPDYLIAPSTFTAAQDWFQRKASLPTDLSARELSNQLPAPIRGQAFFSAKVANAHILENLRAAAQEVLDGKRSPQDGVSMLKRYLAAQGYGIPTPNTKEDRDLANLASHHRLRLILNQNVDMANAVGQRTISEHPFVQERFPNYRYIANTDRHREFNGLVLPKNHPFWQTHYPPWDYGCQCNVVDEDAPPNAAGSAARLDYNGRALNVQEPQSGFSFLSAPADAFQDPDLSTITNPDLRAKVAAAIKDFARSNA